MKAKTIIGWRECVGLPEFGVGQIKAKIDTGARTSSLHAFKPRRFKKDDEDWVRFIIHPKRRKKSGAVTCEAKVIDTRVVVSSNGARERRMFIATNFRLGPYTFPAEVSLTNYVYKFLIAVTITPVLYVVHWAVDTYLGPDEATSLVHAAHPRDPA